MAAANSPEYRYTGALAKTIEQTWQKFWIQDETFRVPAGDSSSPVKNRAANAPERIYVLDMIPYPSGVGLHVGHPLGFIATDVFARFNRMRGSQVLHCFGFDSFGLPAEQFAMETGKHPRDTTQTNTNAMKKQLHRLGLGHDPHRTFSTTDPDYYRWTQWIFRELFDAWFDHDAVRPDGGQGKARPISELRDELASGRKKLTGRWAGEEWSELSAVAQADYINDFRLAYIDEAPVNWAPGLGTVLSNEEVTADGRSERGNMPVFRKSLRQWKMRITAYSERLAADLDRVDWPEKIKAMQRHWIGRSQGARVAFPITDVDRVDVFTTCPHTLAGATFMVLAPEHPLLEQLTPEAWPEGTPAAWQGGAATPAEAIAQYQREASQRSDVDRQRDDKPKTGVFTGLYATNPVTDQQMPIFIAEYVLMGYGTGAVMAVPAHDSRDEAFAEKFDLPIVSVMTEDGVVTNLGKVTADHLPAEEAQAKTTEWLTTNGFGTEEVSYRLRDWLFSRQRYWGEPFPIVYDAQGVAHAIPDSMLPVELPDIPDYSPRTFEPDDYHSSPEPPLGRATDWVTIDLDLGDGRGVQSYTRETNTMPNWAGSCWYYLRYLDPDNDTAMVDPALEKTWLGPRPQPVEGAPTGATDAGGIDLYVGGAEHAVLHLLYARFWHKALYDLGHISSEEPFRKYFAQGYIQAPVYRDDRGQPVPAVEVEETAEGEYTWQGQPVSREIGKIGKSLKNGIAPDDMCDEFGADTFRVYEMSMGPLEQSKPWETRAVVGSQRFLQRLWRLVVNEETGELHVTDEPMSADTMKLLHKTIDAVTTEYQGLHYNMVVAKLIEYTNALTKLTQAPREAVEPLVKMVAPLAPHIAEELWQRLGHQSTVAFAGFPEADPEQLTDDVVTCAVQIMGKFRDKFDVPAQVSPEDLEKLARQRPKVQDYLADHTVKKVIARPPKLINFVLDK